MENNWKHCFQSVFFTRKDILVGSLRQLEPIRNDVAHNRKLNRTSVEIAEGVLDLLMNTLGEERVAALANRCTDAADISQRLQGLRSEVMEVSRCVRNAGHLADCCHWRDTKAAWWFDSEYLATDLTKIHTLFEQDLPSYDRLPKGRGTGHFAEKWMTEMGFDCMVADIIGIIDKVLEERD